MPFPAASSRFLPRAWQMAGLVLALGLTACGSNGVHDLAKAAAASGGSDQAVSTTFQGQITTQPSVRRITLTAGTALRLWARPTLGQQSEDGREGTIELGLAADGGPVREYIDGEGEDSGDSLFSDFMTDQSDEFSDLASSGDGLPDYGIFFWTQYEQDPSDTLAYRDRPPFFADYGRGWGAAAASGSWLTFIAPVTGVYELIVSGVGPFHGGFSTRLTSVKPASGITPSAQAFDNNGQQAQTTLPYDAGSWLAVLKDQESFLYAGGFWPSGFFSDYTSDSGASKQPQVSFDPSTHKARVDRLIAQLECEAGQTGSASVAPCQS